MQLDICSQCYLIKLNPKRMGIIGLGGRLAGKSARLHVLKLMMPVLRTGGLHTRMRALSMRLSGWLAALTHARAAAHP